MPMTASSKDGFSVPDNAASRGGVSVFHKDQSRSAWVAEHYEDRIAAL
jgi:hypothetical protein